MDTKAGKYVPALRPAPSRGPNKWLVAICVVLFGFGAGGIFSLGGMLLFGRYLPGLRQPQPSVTPQPAAVAQPTPQQAGAVAPTTTLVPSPTPQPAAAETPPEALPSGSYYAVDAYPGAPAEVRTVTLPPEVTDAQQLAEAQARYEEGIAALIQERWQDAIAIFDEALRLDPHYAEAYNYRGAAYRRVAAQNNDLSIFLHYNDLAAADFTRGTLADPEYWRPYFNRSAVYDARASEEPLRADRTLWYKLSLADGSQATQLDASQANAWLNLAGSRIDAGEYDAALEALSHCRPWTTEALTLAARIYRCEGAFENSMNLIGQALDVAPDDYSLYVERGRTRLAIGDYAGAQGDFLTAANMYTGEFVPGRIWYDRAAAEYYLGNYDLVEEYIETGSRYAWRDWGAPYYYLGMVYLQEGRVEEGVAALVWAEATLDEYDPLLAATRAELRQLEQNYRQA